MRSECTTRRRGASEIVEIDAMDPSDRKSAVGLFRFVPHAELQTAEAAPDGLRVLSAIPLGHAAGADVQEQLQRYFANLNSDLEVWTVGSPEAGEDLILWGTGANPIAVPAPSCRWMAAANPAADWRGGTRRSVPCQWLAARTLSGMCGLNSASGR